MDYIQKAIDKARDDRGQSSDHADQPNQKEASSSIRSAKKNKSLGSLKDGINYTKTRQVKVPDEVLLEQRIIAGFSFDQRAEPYFQLRTQVLQKLRANSWKTLAITSPNEDAGKTVTAVNLAIALSKEVNQTVLLVDLDLRNPGILKTLKIETEFGLVDHLKGEASITEVLVNPGFERLVILPGKADPNYSSEILSSPEMHELIGDLTSRYESRIIIFDLPALLSNDDALAFIPEVDAALLVVEEGKTTPEQLERSMQLLEGTQLLGTILNKAD